jgi:hypothetical protein
MKVNQRDFAMFVQNNGSKFPYSEIRKTRRHFYVKWIVFAKRARRHSFVTLPSNCVNKDTLNHLIITKQAIPLTSSMNEIVDYMERWGKSEDSVWYQQVVDWLAFICREGIKREHLGVLYDCVALKVRREIYLHAGTVATSETSRIFNAWRTFFFDQYARSTTDFIALKQSSMVFVATLIANLISSPPVTPISNAVVVSP